MKPLWELEVSNDIKERQLFVSKIRDYIKEVETKLGDIDSWDGVDQQVFRRLARSQDESIKNIAESIVVKMDAYYITNPNAEIVKHERRFLKLLKNKLNTYDVYNQQIKYVCSRCKETKLHCVCGELELQR